MNTLDAQVLPSDLVWPDELEWLPVEQSIEFLSEGALLIQEGVKQAGRPITLTGFLSRAQLQALRVMAATPVQHALTYNGTTYPVRWRYSDKAITAVAFIAYADPDPDDLYEVTLRFIEVAP